MLQYHASPPAAPIPLDLIYQALADPGRRGMVERLTRGPATVTQLAEPLPMSLSAVVEDAGIVRSQKTGRVRTCQVIPAALHAAEQWIADRRTFWERQYDQLEAYLNASSSEAIGNQEMNGAKDQE